MKKRAINFIDPIEYAWRICNPNKPFPESLAWNTRGWNLQRFED